MSCPQVPGRVVPRGRRCGRAACRALERRRGGRVPPPPLDLSHADGEARRFKRPSRAWTSRAFLAALGLEPLGEQASVVVAPLIRPLDVLLRSAALGALARWGRVSTGVGVRAESVAGIALPGTFLSAGCADLTFAGESRVHQRPGPTSDREPGTAPAFKTQARRRARRHRCHGRGSRRRIPWTRSGQYGSGCSGRRCAATGWSGGSAWMMPPRCSIATAPRSAGSRRECGGSASTTCGTCSPSTA